MTVSSVDVTGAGSAAVAVGVDLVVGVAGVTGVDGAVATELRDATEERGLDGTGDELEAEGELVAAAPGSPEIPVLQATKLAARAVPRQAIAHR